MPSPKYIINIPQPCHENWQQMTPNGNGRFCAHCSKTVIDFSCMTDAQVVALLQKKEGKLCGRLNAEQLNRVITVQQPVSGYWGKLKNAFAALTLLFTVKAELKAKPPVKPAQYNTPVAEINAQTFSGDTLTHVLSGRVIDSFSREDIIGATIKNVTRFKATHNDSAYTTSSADGCFAIAAEEGDQIEIYFIGYRTFMFTIHQKDFYSPQTYMLRESENLISGDIIIVNSEFTAPPRDPSPSLVDVIKKSIAKRKLKKAAGN